MERKLYLLRDTADIDLKNIITEQITSFYKIVSKHK